MEYISKSFSYERFISICGCFVNLPRTLTKASSVNSTFSGLEDTEVEILEKLLMDSNIKFDYLSLSGFRSITLSPIVKNILLLNTTLISYVIPGVKNWTLSSLMVTKKVKIMFCF